MTIKIKFYGQIAERLGGGEGTVQLPSDCPIDLKTALEEAFPGLKELTWKVAMDQKLVTGPCIVHEGAELALLPPYAGG